MNFLELIFPMDLYCVSCGRPIPPKEDNSIALCERCVEEIVWIKGRICKKCGRPLQSENPSCLCHDCEKEADRYFTKSYACALYSGRAAEIVRDMKYREKPWYSDTLSALMALRYFSQADPDTGELPHYDYIISVPMPFERESSRGYDQAALLAKRLSRRIGVPYLPGALLRVRETGAMSSLSEDERRQNLVRAFSFRYDMMKKIEGKRVLLIDDVFTTGSTVNACAKTLLASGAAEVNVLVFAIGADVRRTEGRLAVVESPGQLRAKGPT